MHPLALPSDFDPRHRGGRRALRVRVLEQRREITASDDEFREEARAVLGFEA